jgi:hypothetical protein
MEQPKIETFIYLFLTELCNNLNVDIEIEKNEETINSVKSFILINRDRIISKTSLIENTIYTSTPIICDKIDETTWNILLKLYDCFFLREKYMNDLIDSVKSNTTHEKKFLKNISSFIEKNSVIENNTVKVDEKDLKDVIKYKDLKSGAIKLEEVYNIYSSVLANTEKKYYSNPNSINQEKLKKLKEDLEKLKNLKL